MRAATDIGVNSVAVGARTAAAIMAALNSHLALLIAGVFSTCAAVKLLRVAHGDVDTAMALLSSGNKSAIAAGILLDSVPVVTLAGLLLSAYVFTTLVVTDTGPQSPVPGEGLTSQSLLAILGRLTAGAVLGLFIVASVVLLAWPAVVVFLFGVIILWVVKRVPIERWTSRVWLLGSGRGAAVAQGGFGLILAFAMASSVLQGVVSDRVWLPGHTITAAGVARTGYVLAADDNTMTVLWDAPRVVERVTPSQEPTLCRREGVTQVTLWDLFRHRQVADRRRCST